MALTPYSEGVPSVAPEGAPANDYQRVETTPAAFGATQGQDLQRAGASLEQASDANARSALMIQERYNQTATDEAYNNYQTKLLNITYGDPAKPGDVGIYGLKGQAAMEARLPVQQTIEQTRQDILGGLKNDAQRLAFESASRRLQSFTLSAIGRHVDSASDQYSLATATATSQLADRYAGANWNDETAWNQAYQQKMQGVAKSLQASGNAGDPTISQAAVAAAKDQLIVSRAESMAAFDPARASQWLKTGKMPDGQPVQDALSSQQRLTLEAHIDALAAQSQGSAAATRAFTGAASRPDPLVRSTIETEARARGVNPTVALTIAKIESGIGTAADSPGNSHKGVFQLGEDEWAQVGGTAADRGDRIAQARRGTAWVAGAQQTASDALGRPAQGWETYVVHQQGKGGGPALLKADPSQNVIDALAPAYGGNAARAAQAVSNNGGTPAMTVGQFLGTWQRKYAAAEQSVAMPTTNDAPGPISGAARRQAYEQLDSDPTLNDKARAAARTQLDRRFAEDDHANHIDAEAAVSDWLPKVRLTPSAVDPNGIFNDNRLTSAQKDHLFTAWQSQIAGRNQGDGSAFAQAYQNVYAPPGAPGRINSVADMIPLLSNGLTPAGMEKLRHTLKERDTPDGAVLHGATQAWQSAITRGQYGQPPTAATQAKYAAFLGVMNDIVQQERAKGMPMAQIVGENGPIAKILPSYILDPADRFRSLVDPTNPNGARPPGPASLATATPPPAPTLTVGKWYVQPRLGVYNEAAPGSPGAKPYGGGPINSRDSWALPVPPAPQAPTTEGGIQKEDVGGGFFSGVRSLFGAGGSPASETVYGDRLAHYPGADELSSARSADFSYGTGNEAFMEGRTQNALSNPARVGQQRKPIAVPSSGAELSDLTDPHFGGSTPGDQKTADLYTAAQLAVLRSPISALGYDPRHVNLDTQSGGKMSVAGAYNPKSDNAYSNADYQSNIVHESTHRGLEALRKAGVVPQELWDRLPKEEDIVRYIMALHMGDPERDRGETGKEQRAAALFRFGRRRDDPQKYDSGATSQAAKYRSALNELTGIAATYFASLHPGGPR